MLVRDANTGASVNLLGEVRDPRVGSVPDGGGSLTYTADKGPTGLFTTFSVDRRTAGVGAGNLQTAAEQQASARTVTMIPHDESTSECRRLIDVA
ncbi:hypothetical protein WEH80_26775 [Actinomycetes bacterium KLBMP 9759]